MANVCIVSDPITPESTARLRALLPSNAHLRTGFPITASIGEPPHWLQVLLDAPTWKIFIGAPATAFLTALGRNAGDDAWKNKGRIGKLLKDAAYGTLSDLAFAIAATNEQIGSAGVRVGLPVPDEHWGAHTSVCLPSPEEISVVLARLAVSAASIEAMLNGQRATYPVLGEVQIDIESQGPIVTPRRPPY